MASDIKKHPKQNWDDPQRQNTVDANEVFGKAPHQSSTPSSKEQGSSWFLESAKEPETGEDYSSTPDDFEYTSSAEPSDEDMGIDEDYAYQAEMDRDSNHNPNSEAPEGLGADEVAANNDGGWPYDIDPQEAAEDAKSEESAERGEAVINKKDDSDLLF